MQGIQPPVPSFPVHFHLTFATRGRRRGVSFCYALVVMSVMLTLGVVFLQVGLNSAKWAYGHCHETEALYLADSAVDHAMWMMQASESGVDGINDSLKLTDAEASAGETRTYESPTITVADGTYSFRAVAPYKQVPGTLQILASGTTKRGTWRQDILTVLRADWNETDGTVIPSPCFDYAVFSDHNFEMKGNPEIRGHPELGGAGVFSNGNLSFSGSPTVYGAIAATGSITGSPTQIPADAGRYPGHARVAMPFIDLDHYRSIADEIWGSGGTVSKSGHIDAPLGTFEDPKIIYVDGSLKLTGGVTMTGIGIIVASKGVEVAGNVTYGDPGNDAWGILTAGSFKLTGTATINASVYCHNATGDALFDAAGTANVFGAVVADVVTLKGNYRVEWGGETRGISEMPGATVRYGPPAVARVAWKRK